jgi:hypothetical protein
MKKVIVGGAVSVAAFAAVRRFGPALKERAMKKCEGMFQQMPEDFPPKQMLRGIKEIREQNTRILHQLDELCDRAAVAAVN